MSSTAIADAKPASLAMVVFWLASGTFAIGCSEFAAMTLLPYYAAGFGVTEPDASSAVSVYALGVMVGAPLIATLCARMPRKQLLVILMGVYALGNALTALSGSLWVMTVARFMSGLPHGAYFGIAMLFAADLAGKGRRAEAVSYIIIGLTIATCVGVPAVNAIGQFLGWRAAFLAIAALAALSTVMVWRTAPADPAHPNANPMTELGVFRNRDVMLALAMGAIGFGGMFAVYSFFSTTLLSETDSPEWMVSLLLIVFGVGGTFGNWFAGRIASGRLILTAGAFQAFLGVACGFYAFAVGNTVLMGIAIFMVGTAGGVVVPLQSRIMDVAGEAQTLAAALNHAAFNLANAIGPWLAGLALAGGLGAGSPGLVGVGLSFCGLAIWAVIVRTSRGQA